MQVRASVLATVVMAPSLVDLALRDWKQHPARARAALRKIEVATLGEKPAPEARVAA